MPAVLQIENVGEYGAGKHKKQILHTVLPQTDSTPWALKDIQAWISQPIDHQHTILEVPRLLPHHAGPHTPQTRARIIAPVLDTMSIKEDWAGRGRAICRLRISAFPPQPPLHPHVLQRLLHTTPPQTQHHDLPTGDMVGQQ